MASTTEIVVASAAMVAGWAAVGVAGYTVWKAERDARVRTAFERIAALEDRVRGLSEFPTGAGAQQLLESADGKTAVGEAGRAFQSMLNSFELLAFAVSIGVADKPACDKYLARIGVRAKRIRDFVYEYRKACGDDTTYSILEPYLRQFTLPSDGHSE